MGKLGGLVALGLILVVLGIVGFAVPYFETQHKEDVARVGDVAIQATQSQSHFIPPYASGAALVAGLVLVGIGVMRRA